MRVDFLVEELPAKAALDNLLPRLLPGCVCRVRVFEWWQDLLGQLTAVLRGYHRRIFQQGDADLRVVVLDGDGICTRRKADLEARAMAAGLVTKTTAGPAQPFHVLNRVAVQELEAWWLGDREAIIAAYPNVKPSHFKGREGDCDRPLKPSDVLWTVLKQGRYFPISKPKTLWAAAISQHIDPARSKSASFCSFRDGLAALR